MQETLRDLARIRLIEQLGAHIARRLSGLSADGFAADPDEVDLAAYRLPIIGETTHKLSTALKARHPEINWSNIYGLRNVVVHDYEGIDANIVWNSAINSLPALMAICAFERERRA